MSPSSGRPSSSHFRLAPVACQHSNCKDMRRIANTIVPEYVVLMTTVCAHEGAHVLHQAKNGYVDFSEQIDASHRIT